MSSNPQCHQKINIRVSLIRERKALMSISIKTLTDTMVEDYVLGYILSALSIFNYLFITIKNEAGTVISHEVQMKKLGTENIK
jgi:hypothetical protein